MKTLFTTILALLFTVSTVFGQFSTLSPKFVKYQTAIDRVIELFEGPYYDTPLFHKYYSKVQYLDGKLSRDLNSCNFYVDRKRRLDGTKSPEFYMDECLTLAGRTDSNGYQGSWDR